MPTRILSFNKAVFALAGAFFAVGLFSADAAVKDIVFPLADLGNCANEQECRAFCDKPDNFVACTEFARKNNLAVASDTKNVDRIATLVKQGGPGNCKTKAVCEAYCEAPSHFEECMTFAERNGLMDLDEVREARRVSKVLEEGASLPGNCLNKKACEVYCAVAEHFEECVTFAERSGIVAKEEVVKIRKTNEGMRTGAAPGGCTSKETCQEYCRTKEHFEECTAFAEKVGVVTTQNAERIRTERPILKEEIRPLEEKKRPEPSSSPAPRKNIDTPKPTLTPETRTEHVRPSPAEKTIPAEFRNGGATNLPAPRPPASNTKQSQGFFSSFLGLIGAMFAGGGVGQ